ISGQIQETRTKRKVDFKFFPVENRKATPYCHRLMEHSDLLEIVRRPLSPDARLEVLASREEYERVNIILERDETKY
ncbi:hypothetical protein V1506DRAFT_444726, partial [Lipomyces tetrasporus]